MRAKYYSKTKPTWAVVTGGSDGIGLEMCRQLAAQSFNIVMVSRNADKIKTKLAEFTTVETKCVAIDLSNVHSIQEYRNILTPALEGLDIGVVCLNAGTMEMGPIDLISDKQLESVYTLNGLHVVYMAKVLLEYQKGRDVRSALIVTGSGLSRVVMPGILSYNSTKILVSRFCEAIAVELKPHNIDVMCWNAGPITTNLNPSKSCFHLSLKTAVSGAFNKVGMMTRTDGPAGFEFNQTLIEKIYSLSLCGKMGAKFTRKGFLKKKAKDQSTASESAIQLVEEQVVSENQVAPTPARNESEAV